MRVRKSAKPPVLRTPGAIGYDIATTQSGEIKSGETILLETGIKIEVPEGTYGRLASRSGLSLKGLHVGAGTIDPDFRGELKVVIHNIGHNAHTFRVGDYVAQLILEKAVTAPAIEVKQLTDTQRGSRGFGSTDTQTPDSSKKGAKCMSQGKTSLLSADC